MPAQDVDRQGAALRRPSLVAQSVPPAATQGVSRGARPRRTASIHWQRVPLRDALGRLDELFEDVVFVDRRVDPSQRVSLDIEAKSAEEVVAAIAAERNLGVVRLGRLVYLGPRTAAEQLHAIADLRGQEVARLPGESRSALVRKKQLSWPRLTEPRRLVTSVVEQHGWRVARAERIPHDLWAAGKLPDLTLANKLTVLLVGFDLTFQLRPNERSIEIVPLQEAVATSGTGGARIQSKTTSNTARPQRGTKQVYTLRVEEQPVGEVLRALSKRLNWPLDIDEASIRAAGRSLETRVSFAVEDADRDKLLKALLTPAGLDYRLEGDRVRIVPRRYNE